MTHSALRFTALTRSDISYKLFKKKHVARERVFLVQTGNRKLFRLNMAQDTTRRLIIAQNATELQSFLTFTLSAIRYASWVIKAGK